MGVGFPYLYSVVINMNSLKNVTKEPNSLQLYNNGNSDAVNAIRGRQWVDISGSSLNCVLLCKSTDVSRAIELLDNLQRTGEVPPQKLQALQRVLQSEFCNAVREVYEHVYETVDISSSPEVRANATAKVCMNFYYSDNACLYTQSIL
ncbi:UNVERIFIED_CONTAM: hypothetical protein FKN15_007990 [Acipenser sinensis]